MKGPVGFLSPADQHLGQGNMEDASSGSGSGMTDLEAMMDELRLKEDELK